MDHGIPWKSYFFIRFVINVSVGARTCDSLKLGSGSTPIGGICIGGGAFVLGDAGPRTQQHAGNNKSARSTVVVDVTMARTFHDFVRGILDQVACDLPLGNLATVIPYHDPA